MSKYRYQDRSNNLADGNKIKFSDLNYESMDHLKETRQLTRTASVNASSVKDEFLAYEYVGWKVVAHGNPGAATTISQDIDFKNRFIELRIYFQPSLVTAVPNLGGEDTIQAYWRGPTSILTTSYYQGDSAANICHAFFFSESGGTSTVGPRAEWRTSWTAGAAGSGTIAIWVASADGYLKAQCTAQATNVLDRIDHCIIVWVKASMVMPNPNISTSTRKTYTPNMMDYVDRDSPNYLSLWQARFMGQDYIDRACPSVKITDQMSNADKTLNSSIRVWSSTTVRANASVLHIPEYSTFDWRGRFIWITGCFKIASNGEFVVGGDNDRNIKAAFAKAYNSGCLIQFSEMRMFEGCFYSNDGAATAGVQPRLRMDLRNATADSSQPVVQFWVSNAEPNKGQLLIYRSTYAGGTGAEDESADNIDMAMLIEASPDLRV